MKNIQKLRLAAGLSQSQLAKLAGVRLRNLQAYESGERDVNAAAAITLLKFARVLNCSIEDLLEEEQTDAK